MVPELWVVAVPAAVARVLGVGVAAAVARAKGAAAVARARATWILELV